MLNALVRNILIISIAALAGGCSHTSSVIDRSETRTIFRKISLEKYPNFKVLLGGAVREMPVRNIRMIKIDPSESIVFEREMYYSAEVILRDGSVLSQEESADLEGRCFVCINNTLVGKRRGETVRVPLENVMRLKFEDD